MPANPLGRRAEDFAAGVLTEQGYRILVRNYHSRYGEVDLIAVSSDTICFVEVKARREKSMVPAVQAVTAAKQKKIIATALYYLQEHPSDLQPRFDVFCVVAGARQTILSYDYLTGAFDSEAYYRSKNH